MKDYSGPAFPTQEVFDERRGEVTQYGSAGMTLRDYFAAKALIALTHWPDGTLRPASDAALIAYDFADAMLTERAKP